jgi:hypothetical protein
MRISLFFFFLLYSHQYIRKTFHSYQPSSPNMSPKLNQLQYILCYASYQSHATDYKCIKTLINWSGTRSKRPACCSSSASLEVKTHTHGYANKLLGAEISLSQRNNNKKIPSCKWPWHFSNLSPQQESFKLIEFTISLHPIKKTASLMDCHSTTHHELT